MYSNNREFRALLRCYFKMEVSTFETQHADLKDADFESYDELLYDMEAMNKGMETILCKTKENPLFQTLYSLAAQQFLSEDAEIGLCVLLSYDYFADFLKVYETKDLTETCDSYIVLKKKLSS
jgi:hypothetical protein|uniref:Uncharacterized protein n=1 Tax=viral metagenome TaxID=1070528 RepID=A0A6C0DY80_9ZZZZ